MNKLLCIVFALVMCLSLCACGNDPVETESTGSSTGTTQGTTEETEATNVMGAEVLKFTLLSDKTYSVAASDELYSYDEINLVIPAEYNGKAVTVIEKEAFKELIGLISVTIPDSVTTIGYNAFRDCAYIENITFPNSIPAGSYFYGCDNVRNFYITDLTAWCNNGCEIPCDEVPNLYMDGQLVTELVIPDGVTSIAPYAFANCTGLTSITIPDSVTDIGWGEHWFDDSSWADDPVGFVGCTSLTNITVAEGNPVYHSSGNCIIETESKTLIFGCSTSTIPVDGSVTSIGMCAFKNCTGLTGITIPDSVTSIGDEAFRNCTNLTNITIPDSVTSIESWSFFGCTSLASISIPDSVTSIDTEAFRDCTSLTNIAIPNGVTSIGSYAVNGYSCPTYFGSNALKGCTSLVSITIPDSVTVILAWEFTGCTSLTDIYYGGTYEQWNTIEKSGYWDDGIGDYTLHCTDGDYTMQGNSAGLS